MGLSASRQIPLLATASVIRLQNVTINGQNLLVSERPCSPLMVMNIEEYRKRRVYLQNWVPAGREQQCKLLVVENKAITKSWQSNAVRQAPLGFFVVRGLVQNAQEQTCFYTSLLLCFVFISGMKIMDASRAHQISQAWCPKPVASQTHICCASISESLIPLRQNHPAKTTLMIMGNLLDYRS